MASQSCCTQQAQHCSHTVARNHARDTVETVARNSDATVASTVARDTTNRKWFGLGRGLVGLTLIASDIVIGCTRIGANVWFARSLTTDPSAAAISSTLTAIAEHWPRERSRCT
jgi:hypothetical protein